MRRRSRGAVAEHVPSIALRDMAVRRGRRTIVGPATLQLEGPALVRLAGANGSGKSTLLRVLAGLQRPTSGRVDASHPVGLLPERFAGAAELRVGHLVDAVRRASAGRVDPVWRERVFAALGVAPLLERPLGGLSHGQAQRTALAAALHVRPPILLLDEPWDGLDADTGDALRELLRSHAAEALVVVTDHGPEGRSGATVEVRLTDGGLRAATRTSDGAWPGASADGRGASRDARVRWSGPDGVVRSGRLSAAGAAAMDGLVATGAIELDGAGGRSAGPAAGDRDGRGTGGPTAGGSDVDRPGASS